jgi:hypothetical protein
VGALYFLTILLNARIVAEAPFYQKSITFSQDGSINSGDELEILKEAMLLL